MKKFELALETEKEFFGIKMFRIRALVSFSSVSKGDLGGYVEKEDNLSQYDRAWIYDNAQVYGNARVYGNAQVYDNALVYGNAQVYCDARVFDNALICGDAWIYCDALVSGSAVVSGDAQIYGNARVSGDAKIYGNARVSRNARVLRFYQSCSITNLNWSFTSIPKGVQVGCHFYNMKEWKENHINIGTENGLTEQEAKAYYELMKAVRKVQHLASKRK